MTASTDTIPDFSMLPDVTTLHPELDEDERWYAAHMLARERAYEAIFGPTEPPDQILSPDDPDLMTNWPGGGIYQFPPAAGRPAWHYVTHGLAQPFSEEEGARQGDPDAVSGLGIELVISVREQLGWPPVLLLDFVRYLLFTEGARLFAFGDRLPYGGFASLGPDASLTHIIMADSPEYPTAIRLPAGRCDLLHLVGVTDAEIARARALGRSRRGTHVLARTLIDLGVGLVTDPFRACATTHPRFEEAWQAACAAIPE